MGTVLGSSLNPLVFLTRILPLPGEWCHKITHSKAVSSSLFLPLFLVPRIFETARFQQSGKIHFVVCNKLKAKGKSWSTGQRIYAQENLSLISPS